MEVRFDVEDVAEMRVTRAQVRSPGQGVACEDSRQHRVRALELLRKIAGSRSSRPRVGELDE